MKVFNVSCVSLLIIVTASISGYSAPSVRKLGGVTTYSGIKNASNSKQSVTLSRGASVRSIKPVNVKPVKESQELNSARGSRLTVGKYLHKAGVDSGDIQPISNTTTNIVNTNLSGNQTIQNLTQQIDENSSTIQNLAQKIEILEEQIKNMQPKLAVQDDDDSEGRVVRSVVLNENNVIELNKANVKIPVGEENSNTAAAIWVEQDLN